jgi:hypothetical protein
VSKREFPIEWNKRVAEIRMLDFVEYLMTRYVARCHYLGSDVTYGCNLASGDKG